PMSGVTGATAPAQSQLNKSQHYGKNWLIIPNLSLNTTFSPLLTKIFPAARLQGALHQNPAKPQSPANHPSRKARHTGARRSRGSCYEIQTCRLFFDAYDQHLHERPSEAVGNIGRNQ